MVKGAPIYGTYGGHYEDDGGDGNTTWVADGPGYWNQDDDNGDTYWVGDKYIIGYEPDVFVPDTTPDTTPGYGGFFGGSIEEGVKSGLFTPVASTPAASTPAAPATTPYTPPDLGLDIPPGNIGGDGVLPVGPPGNLAPTYYGDLGLGIPAAPTYYQEYVPTQQPVVPQQTQAELLQQIVNEGASSDDDDAPGFKHGGLATPNLNPVAQNQGLTSENLPSEGVLEVLRSFNQEGNGANIDFLPNLGEAIRQGRPITQADLTGTKVGLRGTSPVGGGEIGYRLDATLDPLDTGGLVAGADYDVGYKFGPLPPFMKKVLRPTGGGVGIRGAVEGNTADPKLSPDPQEEFYGNLGLNIPLTGTNIEGSFVKPNDADPEYDLRVNQPVGPAYLGYERKVFPERGDAEKFSLDLPNLEASYSKSPFGTNTLQGEVNVPVGDNTSVSFGGSQKKRKGSPTLNEGSVRLNTDVNGTGIGAFLRGDSPGNKEFGVNVEGPLLDGSFDFSGVKKFNSTESNPRDIREGLRLDASATVPLGPGDLSARGSYERDFGENTLGAGLKYTLGKNLSALAEVERRGNNPTETRVGVRYNLPTDKIPDSLKNLFR